MQKKSILSPRGWAVLTLVGGLALASPFLRPPRVDVEGIASESSKSTASGFGRFAASRSATTNAANAATTASDSTFFDYSDFSQQIVPPAGSSPTELPAWAATHSPIDQLILQGTAPPWQSDTASVSTIKPLETWANAAGTGQQQSALPSTLARTWPDTNSLPIADSTPVLSRTQGSLAGTAQHVRPATTPSLRPPANQPPAQPQYVFQPGFHGSNKH